jgi:hypothetical protein
MARVGNCVDTLGIVLIRSHLQRLRLLPDHPARARSGGWRRVGLTDNPIVLTLMLNLILLVLGCIMDMAPIILIATPILLPIATQYCGLDPIQFGIMWCSTAASPADSPCGRRAVYGICRVQATHRKGG